jgi:hypothetical protein
MSAGPDDSRSAGASAPAAATFELERFAWGAPDRLELAGRFSGLSAPPPGAPVLVVRGPERTQRLPAVPETREDDADGRGSGRWHAAFAWVEAPAAFDAAALELGEDMVIELPDPRPRRRAFRHEVLPIRRVGGDGAPVAPAPGDGAERLRLQADLLTAREEARELQQALQRATEGLVRAHEDLEATRTEHAADAERFRDGLATVRDTAEEAVAAERAAAEQARAERAELEAALVEARAGVEAAVAAGRADAERALAEERTAAQAAIEAERQAAAAALDAERRTASETLESERRAAAEVAAGAQAELVTLRERVAAIGPAREDSAAAHQEAERLLRRLTALRDGLGAGE